MLNYWTDKWIRPLGSVLLGRAELRRFRTHHKFKRATPCDIIVVDVAACVVLAVEQDTLYIHVLVAVVGGLDGECASVTDIECGLVEKRRTEYILATCGLNLVKSHRRQHIPCRHGTYILISAKAVGVITIHLAKGSAQQFGSLPRLAYVIVEVNHMMAGLVALCILANKTADVGRSLSAHITLYEEERVEFVDE